MKKIIILILLLMPTIVFAKDYDVKILSVDYDSLSNEEQSSINKEVINDDVINNKVEYKLVYQKNNTIIDNPITRSPIAMLVIALSVFLVELFVLRQKKLKLFLLIIMLSLVPTAVFAINKIGESEVSKSVNNKFSYKPPKIAGYKYVGYIKVEIREADFKQGGIVNLQMRKLAGADVQDVNLCVGMTGDERANCYGNKIESLGLDTTITAIKRSNTMKSRLTADNIVSLSSSEYPIYMWFDQGIIYYYTEANRIYLNEDAAAMFPYLHSLNDIADFSYFDSSKTTDMSVMFAVSGITDVDSLMNWDTSKVITMDEMFDTCSNLTNVDGLVNWNVTNITNMSDLFYDCSSLTNVDGLINWNVSNVRNMSYMFYGCSSLTNVDGLANWDVSNVIHMGSMFSQCSSLTDVDGLANWDVLSVIYMYSMFYGCDQLENIDTILNWDVSNVESFYGMMAETKFITQGYSKPFRNEEGYWDSYGDYYRAEIVNIEDLPLPKFLTSSPEEYNPVEDQGSFSQDVGNYFEIRYELTSDHSFVIDYVSKADGRYPPAVSVYVDYDGYDTDQKYFVGNLAYMSEKLDEYIYFKGKSIKCDDNCSELHHEIFEYFVSKIYGMDEGENKAVEYFQEKIRKLMETF